MVQDERGRKLVAAAIAGLIGLAGIAALVKADHDRDVAEREARLARDAQRSEPARRTLDADYEAAARRAEEVRDGAQRAGGGAGTGEVGPALVGPKRVGPKLVGPGRVGPKRVGPKIVGPKPAAPARTTRWHGGGGGPRRTIADHIHYPPGWTRTPNQAPGRRVMDR